MNRKDSNHANTINWVILSRRIIFVGSPLCWSTTAIWMYRSNPTNTNTLVR